jgi:hypothetical protein
MATAKTKFVVIRKNWIFWNAKKNPFPIRFSRARSRVPKLQVVTVGDDHALVFFIVLDWIFIDENVSRSDVKITAVVIDRRDS